MILDTKARVIFNNLPVAIPIIQNLQFQFSVKEAYAGGGLSLQVQPTHNPFNKLWVTMPEQSVVQQYSEAHFTMQNQTRDDILPLDVKNLHSFCGFLLLISSDPSALDLFLINLILYATQRLSTYEAHICQIHTSTGALEGQWSHLHLRMSDITVFIHH